MKYRLRYQAAWMRNTSSPLERPGEVFFFIGGGGGTPATGNTVEATYGFIGNGSSNHIYIGSDNGFIGGGTSNEIATALSGFASPLSFIGGGEGNAIRTNTAPGTHNVIAGGFFNEICDNSARTMIGGGDHNHAQGNFTFIGGGNQNFALGDGNTVAGGIGNNIRATSQASFIGGGGSNAICGLNDTIAGGNGNGILHGANSSFIGGGFVNFIGNPTAIPASNPSNFSFIGGGAFNCVDTNSLTNSEYNAITGGCCNTIQPGSTFGYIGTGECNVLSGLGNQVVGGTHNNVNGFYSFIGGGNQNTINVASAGGPIGTNGIMMGDHNEITGESIFSGIAAGGNNTINNGYASFIGGGDSSCIQSAPGGANICRSFIGGGNGNCIFDSLNSIVGGEHNIVNNGAAHSFIGGGKDNTVTGRCSAILGGANNNDGGLGNTFIIGSGINAINANSLHVNGLWANGIPPAAFGPFAAGTFFWLPAGAPLPFAPLPSTGQLWIM